MNLSGSASQAQRRIIRSALSILGRADLDESVVDPAAHGERVLLKEFGRMLEAGVTARLGRHTGRCAAYQQRTDGGIAPERAEKRWLLLGAAVEPVKPLHGEAVSPADTYASSTSQHGRSSSDAERLLLCATSGVRERERLRQPSSERTQELDCRARRERKTQRRSVTLIGSFTIKGCRPVASSRDVRPSHC